MGQAEQRQVRTGVAARVREQTASSERQGALLSQVRQRVHMRDELVRQLAGREKGLRAAVAVAIQDADAPSVEAVAAAAGWSVEQVQQLRADLNAVPPDPVPR
jgi:predicted transposase YdaD